MPKKVLLITPPYHCGVLESAGSWMPLGMVYVAGSLQNSGYDVKIYDAMTKFRTFDDIRKYITEYSPDAIGTAAYTSSLYDAISVLRIAKEVNPSIITILGGIHSNFCWEEILQKEGKIIDFIVRGEGEITTTELLNNVFAGKEPVVPGIAYSMHGKIIVTKERPLIKDLDSLPAAWDLIEWKDYSFKTKKNSILAVVSSSRGCTQKCTFCSQRLFWKEKWRGRSPENFVAELEYLNKTYGVDVAMIADETPTFNRERWEKILDLLIEKKLDIEILMETRVDDILRDKDIMYKYSAAGILHIYVGAESASQDTLDRYNKNLKIEQSKEAIDLINNEGIISETSFVLGMPDETPSSIDAAIKLAKYYNPDLAFFLAIAPWPYSDIYKELSSYIEEFDYSKYNLIEPIVKPVNMTREELNKHLLRAFREFYMDKLSTIEEMSEFKKNYMIDVTRLLINDSYLANQMRGEMPPEAKKFMEKYIR
ncbi:MAG: magnesium-protoporphyrin IX monomethyl ester oxidative cyclase [Candidatus Methanoperedenaceae archaeon]|nr:MAG: magnesium-protoporphyrin IX monomethyl ester oxidative cyclase [Candidatus Methanoperedenaceae archaeon]